MGGGILPTRMRKRLRYLMPSLPQSGYSQGSQPPEMEDRE